MGDRCAGGPRLSRTPLVDVEEPNQPIDDRRLPEDSAQDVATIGCGMPSTNFSVPSIGSRI
jgi:hypothetical protein